MSMGAGAGRRTAAARARLVLSQGDPAGIGPELLLRLAARPPGEDCELAFVAERAALLAVRDLVPKGWERLAFVDEVPARTGGCLLYTSPSPRDS